MTNQLSLTILIRISAAMILFGMFLSACDNASKSQSSAPASSLTSTAAVTLRGQIRNDKGTFKSGSLSAADFQNRQVAQVQWQDDNGRFSIEIPAGTGFPVLLTAKASHEGSKLETLVAAVISPTMTKHDITPNSTMVAQKAKALGGYTTQNMMQATLDTVKRPQGDRTVEGFRGDPTKQFGGWH
jgi:hypothetical protein